VLKEKKLILVDASELDAFLDLSSVVHLQGAARRGDGSVCVCLSRKIY
jgi:hypothetical protein